MNVLLPFVVGGLYAAGLYMLLRRSLVRLLVGLALLTHAANLLVFTAGGLVRGRAPIVPKDPGSPAPPYIDPIPQAMILTAIVIGFGVLAFSVVLIHHAFQRTETEDVDQFTTTEKG